MQCTDVVWGVFCAPQKHDSITLSRVETVGGSHSASDPSEAVDVLITQRIGCRYEQWDIYYAKVDDETVVVKMVDLSHFPRVVEARDTRRSRRWDRDGVAKLYYEEYYAFDKVLSEVQGAAVPRLGGMFANGSLYCTLYEDAGRPITVKESRSEAVWYVHRYSADRSDLILEAVRATHRAGVAFHPLTWNWIRRHPDGSIKLTDFHGEGTLVNAREYLARESGPWTPEELIGGWCRIGLSATYNLLERRVNVFADDFPDPTSGWPIYKSRE